MTHPKERRRARGPCGSRSLSVRQRLPHSSDAAVTASPLRDKGGRSRPPAGLLPGPVRVWITGSLSAAETWGSLVSVDG